MTRVLTISQLYPGATTGRQGVFVHRRLRALPERFERRVWRVRPWFPGRGGPRPPSSEDVDGIPVQDVPFFYVPRFFKGVDGAWLLRALKRRPRWEEAVIDAHFAYPAGWAAVRWAHGWGGRAVVTMRGTEVPYARDRARRRRLEECLREADHVIAVSESLAACGRTLGASAVTVIPNGVDRGLFHPGAPDAGRARAGVESGAPMLLTVGGLSERKGVRRVLDVLPGLRARHGDVHYAVVGGPGPEGDDTPSIRSALSRSGLEACVHLLGDLPPEEVAELYRAADVFVLATRHEGWANVLNEALVSGMHVVATDVGGNAEVLDGGRLGRLVPFGDEGALASACDAALADARQGRRDPPSSVLDWDEVGRRVADVIDTVTKG